MAAGTPESCNHHTHYKGNSSKQGCYFEHVSSVLGAVLPYCQHSQGGHNQGAAAIACHILHLVQALRNPNASLMQVPSSVAFALAPCAALG